MEPYGFWIGGNLKKQDSKRNNLQEILSDGAGPIKVVEDPGGTPEVYQYK